ncbi:MAG: hypothetical protein HKN06_05145 [Gammaproteobacteria bacterium]|nr:hypothetical protein [Gammaproteobacteria bacterium]
MPPELETSYIADDPHPDEPQSDIAAISELITGGDPDESEPQQDAAAEQDEQQLPETAEAQDTAPEDAAAPTDPSQVDYDLEIPMPDGMENMTVGQLKDHFRDHQDLQQERDDWEAQQNEQQLELMAARRQLVELAEMLKDVKPEVVDHVQQMQQRDDQQEAELLLKTFPKWADPDAKAAARTEQLDTFKQYGFSEWEYSGITDHRVIKALHDLTQYRKREAAGKAKREQLQSNPPKGQKPPTRKQSPAQERAALIQRAKRGTSDDKTAAISSLISRS